MATPFPVVKVTWYDPHSVDSWSDADDKELNYVSTITSVGMLAAETDEFIVLTLNYDEVGKDMSCSIVIPLVCIKSLDEYEID